MRALVLKVWVGVAMGQRWHRGVLGSDAQTLCASSWSPPCREGRAAACALSGLKKIQQIWNPLSVLPVSHHITQKGSFYPASVASFHFSDALDYWKCLIHIYFCHLFLTTFFFFFKHLSCLKSSKTKRRYTWFILAPMASKTIYPDWTSLWKAVGKEKWHLSTLIKLLAQNQALWGSKYFPFPKVNFGLKYRKLVFVLRVKCFRTHQTSAQKRNFCSSWFDEIGAAKAFLPSSISTERMYLL